jgi:hypothetical protein
MASSPARLSAPAFDSKQVGGASCLRHTAPRISSKPSTAERARGRLPALQGQSQGHRRPRRAQARDVRGDDAPQRGGAQGGRRDVSQMGEGDDEAPPSPRLRRDDQRWQGRGQRLRLAPRDPAFAGSPSWDGPLRPVDVHQARVQEKWSRVDDTQGGDGLGKKEGLPQDSVACIFGREEGLRSVGLEARLGDGVPLRPPG